MDARGRSTVDLTLSSQVDLAIRRICRHDSTQESSTVGSARLDWTAPATEPTPCDGPKAALIYRRTKNLRAVQLLLGHSKLESTVRYLGIEVDDALEISEQTEA